MNTLLISSVVSWMVAAAAAYVAWRTVSEAKRQSALRVASLAADLHADRDGTAAPISPLLSNALFEQPTSDEPDDRRRVALVAGALVVGTVLSLVVGLSALGRSSGARSDTRAAAAGGPPLELVALGHDRSSDSLTVRGVVRNPGAGRELDRLTAVVMLFNNDGSYVESGRAPVSQMAFTPGTDATFAVTLPDQPAASRYRVSFKIDDQVVSHVDKRTSNQDR